MNIDFINRYEAGKCEIDEIAMEFQKMIWSGIVWTLQGHYGRTANALISQGYCEVA